MTVKVSNSTLKHLYGGMLLNLDSSSIKDFFSNNSPDPTCDSMDIVERLEYIWNHKKFSDYSYAVTLMSNLTSFLVDRNVKINDLYSEEIEINLYIMPQTIIKLVTPIMSLIFREKDVRHLHLTHFLELGNKALAPGTLCKYNYTGLNDGYHTGYELVIHDTTFNKDFPTISARTWIFEAAKNMAIFSGYPKFENVWLRSDEESMQKILGTDVIEDSAGIVNYRDKVIGKRVSLHLFMDENGFNYEDFSIPNRNVILACEDIYCEKRKCVVIFKNCIYDSPINIVQFKYLSMTNHSHNPLQMHLARGIKDSYSIWTKLNHLHKNFLKTLKANYAFIYSEKRDKLFINDKPLIGGVPARIACAMLEKLLKNNQSLFYVTNLKNDVSIFYNNDAQSFNLFIKRLCNAINKKAPLITLIRHVGEGTLQINVECTFTYKKSI